MRATLHDDFTTPQLPERRVGDGRYSPHTVSGDDSPHGSRVETRSAAMNSPGGLIAGLLRSKEERRKFYNKLAPYYDMLAERSEQPIRETALDMLSPASGEHILEVGFGTGHMLSRIAEAVGETGQVFGVDLSEKMLEQAALVFEAKQLEDRATLLCGDGESLPFADESMDAVILCFTLELFDATEIPNVLSECLRVLRPNGRIVVAALSKEASSKFVSKAFEWTHRHFPNLMDCRPIHLRQAIEKAGFQVGADRIDQIWMPVELVLAHKLACDQNQSNRSTENKLITDDTNRLNPSPGEEATATTQVHELRNRLYAASLAFRAICKMLDNNNPQAARAAAEAMLSSLSDELQESANEQPNRNCSKDHADGLRVLLVEDDEMESQLLAEYLCEQGYRVSRASDGVDALSQLKSEPLPDVILLDMNMPRLDGPKTITSIRADKRLNNLTLIAISGSNTSSPDLQKARQQVDLWITKPADPERIIAAILELTNKREALAKVTSSA